ncbi:SDR family oxidoreductase [Sphingomonas sp. ac-8]|uniref:SDR family oxidoreductase n=1 Tax=Sphingomonas sp. ac-8 TaxID=3242977 RepID=UPI003A803D2A
MTDTRDAHTAVLPLAGRRVAITGGTTGIGRAIAVLLASEGARVFVCGHDGDHLADALARIREVGEGDGVVLDLRQADAARGFLDMGRERLGGLDAVVLNAATAASGVTEMDEAALRDAIALDFTAYLVGAHAAADLLDVNGDLVLVGSMSAHVLGPHSTVYAGIKAGIAGFAEALRRELGPKGTRVGLVEPGKTGSNMQLPDVPVEKQREQIREETMLRAEDIAVGVHYMLTQPRRTVVQQLVLVPRDQAGE